MTGKPHFWRDRGGGARGAPADEGDREGGGGSLDRRTDGGHSRRLPGASFVARVGAPPLIALATAFSLLALLLCAFFVPGFVLHAEAETTVPTAAPAPATPLSPDQSEPLRPPVGQALVTLPWGDGVGQVGLVRPAEGLTRGPEALAVAPDGRLAVLDSVNSRVVVLGADGSFVGNISLDLTEPRFLAVDDSALYVLDADVDHRLVCLDWQGARIHDAQIPALDDVVTGLFATGDGPCIEVAHDAVFLTEFKDEDEPVTSAGAAPAAGQPAAKPGQAPGRAKHATPAALHGLAGRPLDHDLGKAAKIAFKPKTGLKVKRFKVDKKSFKSTELKSAKQSMPAEAKIDHLVSLDGDGRGGLIIGARLLRGQSDPADTPSLLITHVAAGSDSTGATGAVDGTLTLQDSPFAYLGQPYVVAPDGRIFQPVGGDSGYSVWVHSLPGATSPVTTQSLPGAAAATEAGSPPITQDVEEVQP
jgi:hypothetical protein